MTLAPTSGLLKELVTVEAVMSSGGTTRRVDALALMWVKYEKQLRRVFSFLVFQNPSHSKQDLDWLIKAMVDERHLYPESFARGIDLLSPAPLREMVGPRFTALSADLQRIKRYRNKLLHGQLTGLTITSRQLERDIRLIREWLTLVADGCQRRIGYDGLDRNTWRTAKAIACARSMPYPWKSKQEFQGWLSQVVAK